MYTTSDLLGWVFSVAHSQPLNVPEFSIQLLHIYARFCSLIGVSGITNQNAESVPTVALARFTQPPAGNGALCLLLGSNLGNILQGKDNMRKERLTVMYSFRVITKQEVPPTGGPPFGACAETWWFCV